MQREECIYNLIPQVILDPVRAKIYHSTHDPQLKPTGSTFGLQGQSRIEGSNLGQNNGPVDAKKSAQSFGRIVQKPDPRNYTKKGTGKATTKTLLEAQPKKFSYAGTRKPSLVKREDRPVMGLKSSKDFVTANAVETILAVPGHRAKRATDRPQYTKKVDYGKVPAYLDEVKREIQRENDMIDEFVRENQQLQQDEGEQVDPISEEERLELIDALKAKWDHVNKNYQKIVHNVIFDTQGKVRRKETYENQLTQIEKDIETLQRGRILIART